MPDDFQPIVMIKDGRAARADNRAAYVNLLFNGYTATGESVTKPRSHTNRHRDVHGIENTGALVRYKAGRILDGGNAVQLPIYNAGRPKPSAVGRKGQQVYDDVAGKPLTSNGSVWKDAAGNTVA